VQQTDTDRQTDRLTDRQTDRQTNGQNCCKVPQCAIVQ